MGFIRRAKRWGKLIFGGGIFILIIAYYRLRPDFVSTDDTASFTSYVNGKECKKQLNFHLTKVEKTGSSTLAAILSRFVLRHGKQNVMVMTIGGHLDVTKVQGQIPGWDIGPASNRKAQVLADHARFKESFIEEHFVPGIQRITLVREPVSWFLSAVRFWKQDATSVLTNNLNMGLRNDYSGVKTLFHLSQLQWLGFDYDQRNDLENIKKYVKNIVNKFDIIYLTDQFNPSLIIMKRKFCWDHGDIFYKSMEVYSKSHHLTPAEEEKLLSPDMNLGDKLLYEAFNKSWWKQPEVKDPDFWEEVKHFQKINQLQAEKCRVILRSGKKTYSYTIEASKWSPAIQLTYDRCNLLTMNKYPLMKMLSQYALGYKYYIYQVYHYLTARVSNLF